jgi:hypothetical protein
MTRSRFVSHQAEKARRQAPAGSARSGNRLDRDPAVHEVSDDDRLVVRLTEQLAITY